jgi:hypothetical protein
MPKFLKRWMAWLKLQQAKRAEHEYDLTDPPNGFEDSREYDRLSKNVEDAERAYKALC